MSTVYRDVVSGLMGRCGIYYQCTSVYVLMYKVREHELQNDVGMMLCDLVIWWDDDQ